MERCLYNFKKISKQISIYSNAHALATILCFSTRIWNGSNCRTRSINGWKSFLKIVLKKLQKLLKKCFDEQLELHKVELKGTILKPNMILPGSNSDEKIDKFKNCRNDN